MTAKQWGVLQALSDGESAGYTAITRRMTDVGYRVSGIYGACENLKAAGLVERGEPKTWRITHQGRAALDRLVYRMTRVLDEGTEP